MSKVLYILCGPSGSGKSTFSHALVRDENSYKIVSRDAIRFSLVNENEEYFSKEKEVFRTYIAEIQRAIDDGINVIIADATHINEISRNKLLDNLNIKEYHIIPVNFKTPLNVCLERNNGRIGRAKVPRNVVRRQFYSFAPATYNEKYYYTNILTV